MPTSTGLNTKKMDSKKNLFIYPKIRKQSQWQSQLQ